MPPGGISYFEVRVRAAGETTLASPPSVTLDSAGVGVQIEPWSSAFAADRTTFTRAYVVRVAADAAPGERTIKVTASIGTVRAERPVKVVVRKAEPPPVAAVQPQLTLPAEVVLAPGPAGQFEVRVRAAAGAPLPVTPDVTVEPPAGVRVEPWSSAFTADRTAFTRTFAVRVNADAADSGRTVRVTAVVGAARAEASFKLVIQKPSS
ncbi:MAG TPA: hypothetical protein VGF55_28470 [Gemmataceae bacterium]